MEKEKKQRKGNKYVYVYIHLHAYLGKYSLLFPSFHTGECSGSSHYPLQNWKVVYDSSKAQLGRIKMVGFWCCRFHVISNNEFVVIRHVVESFPSAYLDCGPLICM